jgi:aspartate 1-decarboxylase
MTATMQRFVLHSKIHGARVTLADLNYVGSVTIDADLLEAADLLPHEKILVINLENGARFESYVFEGSAGSGIIGMNGGTARHCQVGDRVLIMSFAAVDERELRTFVPRVVFVDEKNAVESVKAKP